MENANLSQEISRLYKDLSDHILARDGEGANRIYQELLRAGRRDMDRRGVILFA
jgi:DNA-binding FadR family transcriptional regulator